MGKNEKIRIGIIGAGDIASRGHIPHYIENTSCEIISICSVYKKSALTLASKFKIPSVDDNYIALLNRKDIDAVSICTPTCTHKEIISLAVKNKKHILVEKPIALNYQETKWIISRLENYPKKFMVMFNNRYRKENLWLKNMIEENAIGDILLIDMEWFRSKREINKEWLFKKERSGGGVFIDFGTHLIDLALCFIKVRKKFLACGYSRRVNSYDKSDVEDIAVASVIIDDRIIINLRTGWTLKLKTPSKVNINIYGTKGEISNSDYSGETQDVYKSLINDFIRIIIKNIKIDHKIYLDTMKIVSAVYESFENKKTIRGLF